MDDLELLLAEWLGRMTGDILGLLGVLLLYLLAWMLIWGFWTERILSKAGFVGKSFWLLYALLNMPILASPIEYELRGSNTELELMLLGFLVISFWLGIVLTGIVPWPVRQKKPRTTKLINT